MVDNAMEYTVTHKKCNMLQTKQLIWDLLQKFLQTIHCDLYTTDELIMTYFSFPVVDPLLQHTIEQLPSAGSFQQKPLMDERLIDDLIFLYLDQTTMYRNEYWTVNYLLVTSTGYFIAWTQLTHSHCHEVIDMHWRWSTSVLFPQPKNVLSSPSVCHSSPVCHCYICISLVRHYIEYDYYKTPSLYLFCSSAVPILCLL